MTPSRPGSGRGGCVPARHVAARVTGPYSVPKTLGPAHLSFRDRGLTFATTSRQGVCVEFHRPVPGSIRSASSTIQA